MILGLKLIFIFANICFLTARTEAFPSRSVEVLKGGVRVLSDTIQKLSGLLIAQVDEEPINFGKVCRAGLKSGIVEDNQMTASSSHGSDLRHFRPFMGRLDQKNLCWATEKNNKDEWLQVDMKKLTHVTGVITQGRSNSNQWVTSYKISYGISESDHQYIKDREGKDIIFQGNKDRNSHVLNKFPHPVLARYFRLVVQTWYGHISLRMEYTTC